MEIRLNGDINFLEEINATRYHELYKSHLYFLYNYRKGEIAKYSLEYDSISTIKIKTDSIEYYLNFKFISDNKIALLDNKYDKIYFIDSKGNLLHKTEMLNPDHEWHFQNVHADVFKNELIISENGNLQILAIDTLNFSQRIFKDLKNLNSPLGKIEVVGDTIYLALRKAIYRFTEFSEPELILLVDEYNITDFEIINEHIIFQTNFGGNIYYYNLISQELELKVSGLQDFRPLNLSVIDKECIISNGVEQNDKINIYPNPAKSELHICVDFKGPFEILVFDSLGNLIIKEMNTDKLNLENIPSGLYIIRIKNDKNTIMTDKIIIAK